MNTDLQEEEMEALASLLNEITEYLDKSGCERGPLFMKRLAWELDRYATHVLKRIDERIAT